MCGQTLLVLIAPLGLNVFLVQPSILQAATPSCVGVDACLNNIGTVAGGARIGNSSCSDNSGDVARNGCHDVSSCSLNTGAVGVGACSGEDSCFSNVGDIGRLSCRGEEACVFRTGPWGKTRASASYRAHRQVWARSERARAVGSGPVSTTLARSPRARVSVRQTR
jgi:hypothetical protein